MKFTETQIEFLKKWLPEDSVLGRPRENRYLDVMEAIVFKFRTGIPWRELPPKYPNWNTVAWYHIQWRKLPGWDRVCKMLEIDTNQRGQTRILREKK
mgnify:CR=1 FL=1